MRASSRTRDFLTRKLPPRDSKKKLNQSMTEFSNFSKAVWAALKNFKKWSNMVIKAADKSGAAIVWQADLYRQDLQATRQLTLWLRILLYIYTQTVNPHFGQTKSCQSTIQDLITWQQLATSTNTVSQHPIISTLRTSRISLKMKIPNQNRPIVSACSRSTERISSCLDNTITLSGRVRHQTLNQRQRIHFHKRTLQTDRPPQLLISFIFSSTKKEKNKATEKPLS